MTLKEIKKILSEISFDIFSHEFKWRVFKKGDGFLIQIWCNMVDNESELMSNQRGGKHYLSSYCIKDEVVNKAWYACQDFVIHEAREAFKYKNQPIYHPHWTVDKLVELSIKTKHAKRNENSNSIISLSKSSIHTEH